MSDSGSKSFQNKASNSTEHGRLGVTRTRLRWAMREALAQRTHGWQSSTARPLAH
jgi:hypothetical protein